MLLGLPAALVLGGLVLWSGDTGEPPPAQPSRSAPLPPTGGSVVPARCPAAPGDAVEPSYDGRDGGLLTANRDVVDAYRRGHTAEFGGYQFGGGPPATLRVAFTDHVQEHADRLGALVPHPERLNVVRGDNAVVDLERVRETLAAELSGPGRADTYHGLGLGWQAVDLRMNAGYEDQAARYADRFGSAVRITLGGRPYVPAGCGPQVDPPRCPALAGTAARAAGLDLDLSVDTPTINPAQTGKARLTVRNRGTRRFAVDSGVPIVGSLVRPGTTDVVGTWVGVRAGVGGGVDLRPGERDEINVIFGAARCDGQAGSALPAGRYGLRVVLQPDVGGEPRIVSPEVTVRVVPNPAQPI